MPAGSGGGGLVAGEAAGDAGSTTVSVRGDGLAWVWCGDTEPGSPCGVRVFGVA